MRCMLPLVFTSRTTSVLNGFIERNSWEVFEHSWWKSRFRMTRIINNRWLIRQNTFSSFGPLGFEIPNEVPVSLFLYLNHCSHPTKVSAPSALLLRSRDKIVHFHNGFVSAQTTPLSTTPRGDTGAVPSLVFKYVHNNQRENHICCRSIFFWVLHCRD